MGMARPTSGFVPKRTETVCKPLGVGWALLACPDSHMWLLWALCMSLLGGPGPAPPLAAQLRVPFPPGALTQAERPWHSPWGPIQLLVQPQARHLGLTSVPPGAVSVARAGLHFVVTR